MINNCAYREGSRLSQQDICEVIDGWVKIVETRYLCWGINFEQQQVLPSKRVTQTGLLSLNDLTDMTTRVPSGPPRRCLLQDGRHG